MRRGDTAVGRVTGFVPSTDLMGSNMRILKFLAILLLIDFIVCGFGALIGWIAAG